MPVSYKPVGYNSLSPYLIVDGAQKMIALLQTIFDAKLTRQFDSPDGKIMHAELMIDDSILMLSDSTKDYAPNQTVLHVYVTDAAATFKKAIAAGCTSQQEPVQKNDPDLRGTFIDFAGNMWSVGTQTTI